MERYLAMLSAGHQAPLGAYWSLGLDATDPGFWQIGLGMIEGLIASGKPAGTTSVGGTSWRRRGPFMSRDDALLLVSPLPQRQSLVGEKFRSIQ